MRLALLVICMLGCGRRGFEDLPDATRDAAPTGCASTCVLSGHDVYCWGENSKAVIDDTGVDAFAPTLRTALPF